MSVSIPKIYKQRPLRVYYDNKKKKFYILKSNTKQFLELPPKINTLDKAQKYLSNKLSSHIELGSIPISNKKVSLSNKLTGSSIPLTDTNKLSAKDVYKKFIERDPSIIISPEDPKLVEGKELFEKEQKKIAREVDEATARIQEINDRAALLNQLTNVGSEVKNLNTPIFALRAPINALINPIQSQLEELQAIRNEGNLSRTENKLLQERQILLLENLNANKTTPLTITDQTADDNKEENEPVTQNIVIQPPKNLPPSIIDETMNRGPYRSDFKKTSNFAPKQKQTRELEFKEMIRTSKDLRPNGITFDDFEQFDLWNGERSNSGSLFRLENVAKYLVNPNEEKTIRDNFGNMFGIQPDDSIGDLARRVLRHLTPRQYNKLIDDGILPSNTFYKLEDPDQIGYGSIDNRKVLPALYSDQIEEFFEGDPQFAGVIAADEVENLQSKIPFGFIMNLDPRDKPGSHWIACYINGDSVEYFDPLADPPTANFKKQLKNLLKKMNLPVMLKFKVNKIAQQHGGSYKCGYHSIRFLDDRLNNIDFPLASRFEPDKKINNSKEGEKAVKEEFELI